MRMVTFPDRACGITHIDVSRETSIYFPRLGSRVWGLGFRTLNNTCCLLSLPPMLHTHACGGRSFNRRRPLKEGSHLTLDSLQSTLQVGQHAPPFEPSRAPSGSSMVETLFALWHARLGRACLLTLVTATRRDLI